MFSKSTNFRPDESHNQFVRLIVDQTPVIGNRVDIVFDRGAQPRIPFDKSLEADKRLDSGSMMAGIVEAHVEPVLVVPGRFAQDCGFTLEERYGEAQIVKNRRKMATVPSGAYDADFHSGRGPPCA